MNNYTSDKVVNKAANVANGLLSKIPASQDQIEGFVNKAGEYCRQFDMTDGKSATENIACRKDNKWQLNVSVMLDKLQQKDSYQTASGGSLLDSTVEQMADSEFFDAKAESEAIEQHWATKK